MALGGRQQAAVCTVPQVLVLQLRSEDVPRQGSRCYADENRRRRSGVELRHGGGERTEYPAEAVLYTTDEKWAQSEAEEARNITLVSLYL